MDLKKALENAGLTTNETKVYLTLLELGISLAGKIAEIADMHRRPTYDALARLVEKGLVSYSIKSGKKVFNASNPERILRTIKNKEEEFKLALPELIEKFEKKKMKIISEIYEGKEGLKTVMEDVLREKKEWLSIGSTGKGPLVLPFYTETHRKRRIQFGIKRKMIFASTKEGIDMALKIERDGLAKIKFLPAKMKQPQTIWIYGNKVATILVHIEHPVITLIENKEIADSYREYFEWLWENSNLKINITP